MFSSIDLPVQVSFPWSFTMARSFSIFEVLFIPEYRGWTTILKVGVYYTGCSLKFVFFPKILKYSGLWPFSIFPRCQCVYTHQAGRKPALQQNWQSLEKSQNYKEKTQYFINTLHYKCFEVVSKVL